MGAHQSNLSSTGFDYVVAVTQDSINSSLEEYLYRGLPEVVLCYTYDSDNNPVAADYAAFVASAQGTDPFSVPDGTAASDPRVQNLNNAAFAFAVRAKLGLPPGVAPAHLPPIVQLKPGQSNVTYTLMFAEFVATELVFGRRGSMSWVNQSQPSGTPWTFTGAVDLDFQDASFTNLPPGVQARLKDVGQPNTFSVQQLYYDLNSSNLEQGFQFTKVPSNSAINAFMTSDFIDTYWKALGGASVLGYGAQQLPSAPPSQLAVSDLDFFTPYAVGTAAPLTLNYLCATNGDTLPATTHAGFGWDWVDAGEVSKYDGVAALNRNTFVKYLNGTVMKNGLTLTEYAQRNCYSPWVRVWLSGPLDGTTNYSWNMTPGQAPTVSLPASGGTILSMSYQSPTAEDDAGLNGDMGKMKLSSGFSMDVSVQGNQMVIDQHLVVNLYVRSLQTGAGGNVIDKQITDTYAVGVDDHGRLVATLQSSVPTDNSQTPSTGGFLNFFTGLNDVISSVAQWAQGFVGTGLGDVSVSLVQNFVFPGGATFSFADASFSDNQDLVSHITYAAPS